MDDEGADLDVLEQSIARCLSRSRNPCRPWGRRDVVVRQTLPGRFAQTKNPTHDDVETPTACCRSYLLGTTQPGPGYVVLPTVPELEYSGCTQNPPFVIWYRLCQARRLEIIPPFYETTGCMSEINLNAPTPALAIGLAHLFWRRTGPDACPL